MKLKQVILGIVLLMLPILVSGCWDSQEINTLGIVAGMGIDKQPDSQDIALSVQVIDVSSIGGGEGTGKSGGKSSYVVLSGKGKTIFEAIDNIKKIFPRRLIFSHCKIIIVGRTLAEQGVSEIMDSIERDVAFRRTNFILVADKTAKEALTAGIEIEKVQAQGIAAIMSQFEKTAVVYPTMELDFALMYKSDTPVSYAPLIQLEDMDKRGGSTGAEENAPSKRVYIGKTAILKDNRLIGVLDEEESKGLIWMNNKVKNEVVAVPFDSKYITMYILETEVKKLPEVSDGDINFQIKCKGKGYLRGEGNTGIDLDDTASIKQLEKKTEATLKKQIEKAIKAAQEKYNADFLGFASEIHNYSPSLWREVGKEWDEQFTKVSYQLDVDIEVVSTGMTKNFTLKKEDEEVGQ